MGACTAYYLVKLDPSLKIIVVERDFSYEKSSSTLSAANIRTVGFSQAENVLMSLETINAFKTFEEDMAVDGDRLAIHFQQEGNLILTDPSNVDGARKNCEMAKKLGADVFWLEPTDIKKRFPMLNMEGIAGASYGPESGHVDVYSLIMAFKKKGKQLGIEYIEDEVVEITGSKTEVTGGRLGSGITIFSEYVINCAGAWAADLMTSIGIELPVSPTRRQIFAMETKVTYNMQLPLIVHPSGIYFRPEGDVLIAGKSLPEDPVGYNFDWEKERFMEVIWPGLMDAVPDYAELRLIRGWSGLYEENTLDHNAIIGACPGKKGLYLCNCFSGHGVMQGIPAGHNIAETIIGKIPTLDLSIFSMQRIFDNCPVGKVGRY